VDRWSHHDEFPVVAMHPGFLALIVLADTPTRWQQEIPLWEGIFPCYWIVLTANIVFARWWLVRNFERLAGRTEPVPLRARARMPGRPAVLRRKSEAPDTPADVEAVEVP
jgi:hypothetical protein